MNFYLITRSVLLKEVSFQLLEGEHFNEAAKISLN